MAIVGNNLTPQSGIQNPEFAYRSGRSSWEYVTNFPLTYTGADLNLPYFEIKVPVKALVIHPMSQLGYAGVYYFLAGTTTTDILNFDCRSPLVASLEPNPTLNTANPLIPQAKAGNITIIPYGQIDRATDAATVGSDGPTFGVIAYFDIPPALATKRPALIRGPVENTLTNSATTLFTAVAYDRNQINFTIKNSDASDTVTDWTLQGLTFDNNGTSISTIIHTISSGNTIAASGTASYTLSGARFDAYRLRATGSTTDVPVITWYELED